jgi:hypothetical protein
VEGPKWAIPAESLSEPLEEGRPGNWGKFPFKYFHIVSKFGEIQAMKHNRHWNSNDAGPFGLEPFHMPTGISV